MKSYRIYDRMFETPEVSQKGGIADRMSDRQDESLIQNSVSGRRKEDKRKLMERGRKILTRGGEQRTRTVDQVPS